jgi:hypothetical protein
MDNTVDKLPLAIWEGEFQILGVTLKCVVLDDGRRVIDGDSLELLFEAMGSADFDPTLEDFAAFARWIKEVR